MFQGAAHAACRGMPTRYEWEERRGAADCVVIPGDALDGGRLGLV
jgi:hypothetical protein